MTEEIIRQYYQNILQGDPSDRELEAARSAIQDGKLELSDFLEDIVCSAEAYTYIDPIIRLYQVILDRLPDRGAIWKLPNELRIDSSSLPAIAGTFVHSTEFAMKFGQTELTDDLLHRFYRSTLNRQPSDSEISHWLTGARGTADVLLEISNSEEFQSRTFAAVLAVKRAAGTTANLFGVYDGRTSLFDFLEENQTGTFVGKNPGTGEKTEEPNFADRICTLAGGERRFFRGKRVWHTSELDEFVSTCELLGGIDHPNAEEFIEDFTLTFDTVISDDLDPLSDEYHQQQINLYEEIAGRKLDQSTGEHTVVPDNVNFPNPYGLNDVRFVTRNTRAILTALTLADLEPGAWVLDMGCGWGLSTETIAYTGANVLAYDINADFLDLVEKRCAARHMSVKVQQGEFDDFSSDIKYDMVFFYECLHHSTSILGTLRHVSSFVKDDGCIIFCGEPIANRWWKSWGMRCAGHPVYCMRKFGWFESGWNDEYLKSVFSEIGWKLWLIPGIGLDNGYVGLAVPQNTSDDVLLERMCKVMPNEWAQQLLDNDMKIPMVSKPTPTGERHGVVSQIRGFLKTKLGL